jgi:hypothetical protein
MNAPLAGQHITLVALRESMVVNHRITMIGRARNTPKNQGTQFNIAFARLN